MFGLFKKSRAEMDQRLIALFQGQINGLYIVLGAAIDRLPSAERDLLIESLKHAVGRGFGGKGPFLDEPFRQPYNDSISLILQGIIEGRAVPDTPIEISK